MMKSNHEQQKKHTSTHSAILLTTRRCFHNIAIKLIKINPWFHQFLKQKKILSCTSLQGFYQVNQPESIWENDGKWLGTVTLSPTLDLWPAATKGHVSEQSTSPPGVTMGEPWNGFRPRQPMGISGAKKKETCSQWYPEKALSLKELFSRILKGLWRLLFSY